MDNHNLYTESRYKSLHHDVHKLLDRNLFHLFYIDKRYGAVNSIISIRLHNFSRWKYNFVIFHVGRGLSPKCVFIVIALLLSFIVLTDEKMENRVNEKCEVIFLGGAFVQRADKFLWQAPFARPDIIILFKITIINLSSSLFISRSSARLMDSSNYFLHA